ncbi:MAG: hypothetical protein WCO98_04680 [bacterium]
MKNFTIIFCLIFICASAFGVNGNLVTIPATRGTADYSKINQYNANIKRFANKLISSGAFHRGSVPPVVDAIAIPEGWKPSRKRNAADFTFNFSKYYVNNNDPVKVVDDASVALLKDFLGDNTAGAYSRLISIYGAPYSGGELTFIKGDSGNDNEAGIFNPADMTITIPAPPADLNTTDNSQYGMTLMHLMLHAFHGANLIGYDAWEEGMARAGSLITYTLIHPEFDTTYSMEYLLPLYDHVNQPALASPSVFTGTMTYMPLYRIGMATSAWIKIYTENPNAFKDFNTRYYSLATADSSILNSLTRLKGVLSGVVPSIEGLAFNIWYDGQYALSPAINTGANLYIYSVPLQESVLIFAHYFTVTATGNGTSSESPLTGTANIDFTTWDGVSLYPEEGYNPAVERNQFTIPSGIDPGVGTISPSFYNIGDPPEQRIDIAVSIGINNRKIRFPYWTRGNTSDEFINGAPNPNYHENEFFGAVTEINDGSVQIGVPGLTIPAVVNKNGTFSYSMPGGKFSFFSPVTFQVTSSTGSSVTFNRNIGPGFYSPVLKADGSQIPVSKHLYTVVEAGSSLLALPVNSTKNLISDIITNVTYSSAWWNPAAPGTSKYKIDNGVPALTPGMSVWVKLQTARSITIDGTTVPMAQRIITLQPGWNLIGGFDSASWNPWSMQVESDTGTYSIAEAISKQIIGPFWSYTDAKGYHLKLLANWWEGLWAVNLTSSPIRLHPVSDERSARSMPVLQPQNSWCVNLQANYDGIADNSTWIGAAPECTDQTDGYDWVKPPAISDLSSGLLRSDGKIYATDYRSSQSLMNEWQYKVTAPAGKMANISWTSLNLPKNINLTITDSATGIVRSIRSSANYQFNSTGDTRTFIIKSSPRNSQPLFMLCRPATDIRGKFPSTNIQLMLSESAQVKMEIRTMTGTIVNTSADISADAGKIITIPLSSTRSNGINLPAGNYLVIVTGVKTDGTTVRQTLTIPVRR